jgi:hypothetical protein
LLGTASGRRQWLLIAQLGVLQAGDAMSIEEA